MGQPGGLSEPLFHEAHASAVMRVTCSTLPAVIWKYYFPKSDKSL